MRYFAILKPVKISFTEWDEGRRAYKMVILYVPESSYTGFLVVNIALLLHAEEGRVRPCLRRLCQNFV